MRFILCLVQASLFMLLSACEESEKQADNDPMSQGMQPGPPRLKRLNSGGFNFDVSAAGTNDNKKLLLSVRKNGQLIKEFEENLNGDILEVLLGDLNGNSNPEIYVFVGDKRKNMLQSMRGYEFSESGYASIQLPKLEKPINDGYRGADKVEIEGNRLIRHFPIFKNSDLPNEPSDGMRSVSYALNDSLMLEIAEINNLKQE